MDADTIFQLSGPVAIAGWLSLFASPWFPSFADRFASIIVPALLSVAYVGLMLAFWSGAEGGFDTLDNVALLFQTRELLLAGWLHYLAFDLFVGRWTWQRLVATGQPIYVSFPVLFFSMMVAPLGALLGLIVTRNFSSEGAETGQQEA